MEFIEQDNRPERESSRTLGERGERLAAEYLQHKGYRLVLANFTVPIGRNLNEAQITGEIDLIAFDGDTLCFVEVKTRSSNEFTGPLSAVDLRKQRQIIRAARFYLRTFGIRDVRYRFDVVTIVAPAGQKPNIELIKGYWDESRFRKRTWSDDNRPFA
jgi:putative endonuclease